MAEEGSVCDLEGLEKQLQSLSSRYTSHELLTDSKPFCSDFCKLVEEFTSRWQVPLPQLRILERSLCHFARASTSLTPNCDHVLHTLSSLALSVFELLLFFDHKDFSQEPLKHFAITFQECYLVLERHQNVHLLQVERLIRSGGLWACPALQSILSGSSLPQNEVDGCISSELPVFFELRVRYLLSCERVSEAMALARCCAWHPTAGQHLFFLQVYLTWLCRTSRHDSLHKEVANFSGKDAVHIICSLECEEKDELLLALSRAFLSKQLLRGDMYYLCDLVFIWSKLHRRLKTSKPALLEEIQQLMLTATNVNSIFPFIRAILQEVGDEGIQLCVELCANALKSCSPCDVITKSLICKTIAGLLPDDLEVCRASALLVFFLERTVEAYKTVYLHYMHPDQEYHVEHSPIRNHVRFETLQILKKDLLFDPEFWNLIALRSNCLKLMSEKVVSAALEEIMEDKWILNYCTKEPALQSGASASAKERKGALQGAAKKRLHKETTDITSKRLKLGPGKTRLNNNHAVKRKANQGSRTLKAASSEPLRRSFWQLGRQQDNGSYSEHRRITRLSEKNPPKRRIRTPKWLLEDSGRLEVNSGHPKMKRHGLKHPRQHQTSVAKSSESGQIKINTKHKSSINSHFMTKDTNGKPQKESLDCLQPDPSPQVILELSLPDNELMGTFIEDTCNRQRGFPQVLFYKPTVKRPAKSQPVKTVHGKEVVLRARDAAMFVQQLHCYARRTRGKGNGSNIQGSVSTITRSSVQGSPPKGAERELSEVKDGLAAEVPVSGKATSHKTSSGSELSEKSAVEMKVILASQTPARALGSPVLDKATPAQSTRKVLQGRTKELPEKPAAGAQTQELCEESAVEMKVTIASQSPAAGKAGQSPGVDNVSRAQIVKDASKTTLSSEIATEELPSVPDAHISSNGPVDHVSSQSEEVVLRNGKQLGLKSPEVLTAVNNSLSEGDVSATLSETSPVDSTYASTNLDMSALTLVTEMVLPPKQTSPEDSASKDPGAGRKPKVPHKSHTTSSSAVPELEPSLEEEDSHDSDIEFGENGERVETEESRLVYCCTFCTKVFKGSRVVAHAMFHYRRDECMFCGTTFKDDLLAMMHLSNHIEKLKKSSKQLAGNKTPENHISETKDISTPKTSAKAKITKMSPRHRSSVRQTRSSVCLKSASPPDSTLSRSRSLRSSDTPVNSSSVQQKKPDVSMHLNSKALPHKVNGHVGIKKRLGRPRKDTSKSESEHTHSQPESPQEKTSNEATNPRLQGSPDTNTAQKEFRCSSNHKMKVSESLQVLKIADKQDGKVVDEKNVCCPVVGCAWFTDLSKNRVALLYHALDDHNGELRPLELAFRIGNGRCSICMRVLWSFEHFQHHVVRHRLTPRHPCLHQGCTARFKTGIEMRRHTRKHSPLQAVCCVPGCSQLFICLWALNLHEREHYASKPTKTDKNTSKKTDDQHTETPSRKNQPELKDEANTTTVNKTKSRANVKVLSTSPAEASVSRRDLKSSSDTKHSHVLKNLSNKNTSAQTSSPNLRLRQKLAKMKERNASSALLKNHGVISSSLFKRSIKRRHNFRKRQVKVNNKVPKRRGRPPKSQKDVHDENTTTGQSSESTKVKAEHTNASSELTDKEKGTQVKDAEKSTEVSLSRSNSRKLMNKQIKKNHVRHSVSVTASAKPVGSNSKQDKRHRVKKRSGGAQAASTDSSTKKTKLTNGKADAEIKINSPEPASKKSDSDVPQVETTAVESSADDEGKAKAVKAETTQHADSPSELTASPSASGENTAKTMTEEQSEKSHSLKKEVEKDTNIHSASEEPSKKKGCKVASKTRDTKTVKGPRPRALKATVKSESAAVDERPHVDPKAKEESANAALDSVGSSTSPPAATAEKKEKSKKRNVTKNPDPNKAHKKRKVLHEDAKTVKKKRNEKRVQTVSKKLKEETEVKPSTEAKAGAVVVAEEGKPAAETPQPAPHGLASCVVANGKAAAVEEVKASVCQETLAKYGKKPYLRLPPTAYLSEKYITMPKRRKEVSSPRCPEQQATAAAATGQQRQRCANCFATFTSAEDLQQHLQQQNCSKLFGFDSDDDGNS
ncbi:uncharacterized protein V6R79_019057 [Siganus canaliculatus]